MIPMATPIGFNPSLVYPQTICYQQLPANSQRSPQINGNCLNSILWLLALIFFAWPLAVLVCPLYVLLSPFGPCCKCMSIITDALLVAVMLPRTCSENMLNMTPFC